MPPPTHTHPPHPGSATALGCNDFRAADVNYGHMQRLHWAHSFGTVQLVMYYVQQIFKGALRGGPFLVTGVLKDQLQCLYIADTDGPAGPIIGKTCEYSTCHLASCKGTLLEIFLRTPVIYKKNAT